MIVSGLTELKSVLSHFLIPIIDFGLLVLIWIIQLVVYPGFMYFNAKSLLPWHNQYTFRISLIVVPLMFTQLGLYLYGILQSPPVWLIVNLVMVAGCWIITFGWASPLHSKIATGYNQKKYILDLIRINWVRTGLWSLISILSLIGTY